jgi:hypothetical protein
MPLQPMHGGALGGGKFEARRVILNEAIPGVSYERVGTKRYV